MKLFIDTSALVKYFHDEEGTAAFLSLQKTIGGLSQQMSDLQQPFLSTAFRLSM